jgi:hypothetical protein
MKTTFRFHRLASDVFGSIYRPYADILVYGPNRKPRTITMVVDTGADYTIFPRREAALFGIDLSRDCTIHTTYGVGGPETVYLYPKLEMVLGEARVQIPVGFLNTNEVPPLLGRHQCLERFKTCFDQHVVSFERA